MSALVLKRPDGTNCCGQYGINSEGRAECNWPECCFDFRARYLAFMGAVSSNSAWTAARALNVLTPGVDWRGCGKRHMAKAFAGGADHSPELRNATIQSFRAALELTLSSSEERQ